MTAPTMASRHPAEPGTRACWAAGCAQYECVIAADIDPVVIERHLREEPMGRRHMFSKDEKEELLRRRDVVDRRRRSAAGR